MRNVAFIVSVALAGLLGACSDGAQGSGQTGSLLTMCETHADCEGIAGAVRCSDEGFCVGSSGEPIPAASGGVGGGAPDDAGPRVSGQGAGGSGGSGTSGAGGDVASGGNGGGTGASDASACPVIGCAEVCSCDPPQVPAGCSVPVCRCPAAACDGGTGDGGDAGLGCLTCDQACLCNPPPNGPNCPECQCPSPSCDGVVDPCTGVGGWGQTCATDAECGAGERCCENGGACLSMRCIAATECPTCQCDCNSPDTPIATPTGERAVADLREGDLVWSIHRGERVAVPVVRVGSHVVTDHAVVRLLLDNGAVLEISGTHPMADGRPLEQLAVGDRLGEVTVVSVSTVPYTHERTYDILPASDTGTYFAGGALIGSTLFAR